MTHPTAPGAELPILNCDNCGACCQNIGHPQFYPHKTGRDTDLHWQGLPQWLRDEVVEHIQGLEDVDIGQPCIWLDRVSLKCKHYEHRPQMCRDFEVGSFHCRRMRQEQGIQDTLC